MRTMTFRGVFAMAVLLAVAATPAFAQSLIRGTVVDAQNKPVEGALIVFEQQNIPNKRDVKTDKKGEFIFMGLASGPYKVTASKDGVGTHTQSIDIQQMKMQMNFSLRPEAAASAGPKGVDALAAAGAAAAGKEPSAKDKEQAALQSLAATAMAAYKAGKHEDAITGFNELVGKLPSCVECYTYLGTSYIELKKYDEAEAALKKGVAITPTVEGYTALTRIYNTQRKFDLAAEASQKAADLAAAPAPLPAGAPGAAPAAGAAGAGAAGAVAAAAPAPSANSETLFNQGVVLWNQGKYAEAKTAFEAAVKANPKNADAQYQLAMANLNLGQIPAARQAFEAYLQAAPDGSKAAEVKSMLTQLPK